MIKFFDPTGIIQAIARYVAFPHHPHDNVCFHGLPFAHNREHIANLRMNYAKAILWFSYMNHNGLNSNCSSFAEYLRSSAALNILKLKECFSYFGDLFLYRGQHLNFGDVVAIFYLRNKEFEEGGFFSLELRDKRILDFALKSKEDAESKDYLRTYTSSLKRSLGVEYFPLNELLGITKSIFISDFHFLTCVSYEINRQTGNLEPLFIGQDGRNVSMEHDKRKILLPPFGNIELTFMSDNVAPEEDVPAFVLCSKPF